MCSEMQQWAVVGAGLAGTATFVQLVRMLCDREPVPSATIYVIEAGNVLGSGFAYHPELMSKVCLLNTAAGGMGIVAGAPEDFVDWLRSENRFASFVAEWRDSGIGFVVHPADDVSPGAFYPRLWYGRYLTARFEEYCLLATDKGIRVECRLDTKLAGLTEAKDSVVVRLVNDKKLMCQRVTVQRCIVCTGHGVVDTGRLPRPHAPLPAFPHTSLQANDGIIGVMGTGLTAIDAVMHVASQCGTFNRTTTANGRTGYTFERQNGNLVGVQCYSPSARWPMVRGTVSKVHNNTFWTRGGVADLPSVTLPALQRLLEKEWHAWHAQPLEWAKVLDILPHDSESMMRSVDVARFGDLPDGASSLSTILLQAPFALTDAFERLTDDARDTFHQNYFALLFRFIAPMPVDVGLRMYALMEAGFLSTHRGTISDGSRFASVIDCRGKREEDPFGFLTKTGSAAAVARCGGIDVDPTTRAMLASTRRPYRNVHCVGAVGLQRTMNQLGAISVMEAQRVVTPQ